MSTSRIVPFNPRELKDVKNSKEFVVVMRDVLCALAAYDKAGMKHGNICPANAMSVDLQPGEPASYGVRSKGILLHLDSAYRYKERRGARDKTKAANEGGLQQDEAYATNGSNAMDTQ